MPNRRNQARMTTGAGRRRPFIGILELYRRGAGYGPLLATVLRFKRIAESPRSCRGRTRQFSGSAVRGLGNRMFTERIARANVAAEPASTRVTDHARGVCARAVTARMRSWTAGPYRRSHADALLRRARGSFRGIEFREWRKRRMRPMEHRSQRHAPACEEVCARSF
jgi:hypothetical protein